MDITTKYEEDPVVKKLIQEYSMEMETKLQKVIGWAGVMLDARFELENPSGGHSPSDLAAQERDSTHEGI